jgi:hypothetical protein
MPSFEIPKGPKKPFSGGPQLPQTNETRVLPRGHQYREGSVDVEAVRQASNMKRGFDGRA